MEMRGMSGELLGTIGSGNPLEDSRSVDEKAQAASVAEPSSPPSAQSRPSLPPAFTTKKRNILAALHPPDRGEYSDKSPKGSVDAQIADLIDEINAHDGLVTTSSCAGRVSVFLEGEKARAAATAATTTAFPSAKDAATDDEPDASDQRDREMDRCVAGGKGLGGRWLLVSHEPLGSVMRAGVWSETFNLLPPEPAQSVSSLLSQPSLPVPRLVKFAFEPLILHVLCASLRHAQPLLAAAANAGFRESGVQSLKILDEKEREGAGVMVGIRTAGLGLESVIGILDGSGEGAGEGEGEGHARAMVSEDYLDLLVRVAEERFKANEERRERFRKELREHMERFERLGNGDGGWEDKDVRARRKRQEGLERQRLLLSERTDGR